MREESSGILGREKRKEMEEWIVQWQLSSVQKVNKSTSQIIRILTIFLLNTDISNPCISVHSYLLCLVVSTLWARIQATICFLERSEIWISLFMLNNYFSLSMIFLISNKIYSIIGHGLRVVSRAILSPPLLNTSGDRPVIIHPTTRQLTRIFPWNSLVSFDHLSIYGKDMTVAPFDYSEDELSLIFDLSISLTFCIIFTQVSTQSSLLPRKFETEK